MRYIITWTNTADSGKPVRLLSYACEIADTPEQAARQHVEKHADHRVEAVTPSTDKDADLMRYGMGAWTDEEQAEHRAQLNDRYAALSIENSGIKVRLLTYEPDELARETEYMNRREAEATQNAEGVHVGDIFYTQWGYDQTNIDFYQVVELKGKHTMILRGLTEKCELDSSWNGKTRPIRDAFREGYRSGPYTVRTKPCDPRLGGTLMSYVEGRRLYPVEFGKLYDYSMGA